MMSLDYALGLEFLVRTFDCDHADVERGCQTANRRQFPARLPIADGDPLTDLLHDLGIHGPRISLRDVEATVHIYIHSLRAALVKCYWAMRSLMSVRETDRDR